MTAKSGNLSAARAILLAVAVLLSACGGGGDKSSSPPLSRATFGVTTEVLQQGERVVIRFDATVEPESLQMTGSLASEAAGTWSKTIYENDTYTLAPLSGSWTAGEQTLHLAAKGKHGGEIQDANREFLVPLTLESFQAAEVVVGQPDFLSSASNGGDDTLEASTLADPSGNPAMSAEGQLYIPDGDNGRVLGFSALPTTNGAAASFALGPSDFVTRGNPGPTTDSMAPSNVSIAKGKMAVSDLRGNRVLIYRSVPNTFGARPDVVVGQPDFFQSGHRCTRDGVSTPDVARISPDGKLVVADSGNHRILIWNSVPERSDSRRTSF